MADPVSQTAGVIGEALRQLESELRSLRTERDEYRDRWLKQVDVNDRLRGQLAEDALRTHRLEAMCRE